ncbi:AMP-binding protein [Ornithinimicrobium sufpigmenti]|uniref:AMP-binding protein n=1 Tax=Ornithinimicrobium sufpigmenti TaxID=2508882 RepID=UPI0015E17FEB|nr:MULTISPECIES: AMP-binding protein [unclassified Ornithinimicrobium]
MPDAPLSLSPSAHVDTFCRDNLPPRDLWPEFIFEVPEVQYPAQLNVGTVLLDDVIDQGGADRPCILAPDGTRWTYGELREHANRIAHVFVDDLGLVPGNRVLLRGPNNPWLVAIWIAALKAGAVIVPTMPMLRSKELLTICEIGNFNLAVCDHRFTDDLLNSQIPGLRMLTYGATQGGEEQQGAAGLDDILALARDKPTTFEDVPTAADDVSMLAFTSGTTGRPKATMHFHRDILANADTFSRYVLRPAPDDVFIGTPPIAFTFGLGGLVIFPLRVGASTIMVEKATPEQLADLIEELGATVCFTAPTAYKAMLAKGRAPALRGLRRAVSAGEHLPRATWEEFHEATGLKLIDGIGSTEMLHIFIGSSDDDIRPGSTGKPVPGYRAKVIDKAGRDAPDGVAGRLAVKGPTGCRYLADERQTVYVQDGWNITGDTFIRDEDGYFWYQARSDDMIISAGYNISGTEVEEALISHPEVMECAVVAAPDEERGYVVKAYVVPRRGRTELGGEDGEATLRKTLQDHVKGVIAPYKYPRQIEFLDALPRTSTGKVQRFVLRKEAATAATGSVDA